ncbi:MAG: hypothetical protein IJF88_03745, partial [Oscillospiraceae bacterium]|nr:hypothetical protein [Oscillospiraceae bacterium]
MRGLPGPNMSQKGRVDGWHCCRRPSRNRTCAIDAYGSSSIPWGTIPDVFHDFGRLYVVVPDPPELVVVHTLALAAPIQHFEPFYIAQKVLVLYIMLQKLHEPVVVYIVKEAFDVRFQYIVDLMPHDC